jgi:hypothetical protein
VATVWSIAGADIFPALNSSIPQPGGPFPFLELDRYASLFFIVGCLGKNENELETLEFIHCLVETMDRYFER